jgi:hypothetical protein
MFKKNRDREHSDDNGARLSPGQSDSLRQLVIYPEMLSQEVTFELVKRIARQQESDKEGRLEG